MLLFAPIVGEVPSTVGANELGPLLVMDFSVGELCVPEVWSWPDSLPPHADSAPIAAIPATPTHAATC